MLITIVVFLLILSVLVLIHEAGHFFVAKFFGIKLYGEDEAGSGSISLKQKEVTGDTKRAFFARPVWRRALVVFAGVFMNFVLAVVIISVLFSIVGVQTPGNKVTVDAVVKGAPAQESGLKAGDIIISANQVSIISAEQLVSYAKSHLGEKLNLKISDQKS